MQFIRLVCLLTFLLLATNSWSTSISICADEWYPINREKEELPGYGLEIARAVFAAHNIEIVYLQMPWKRAIEKAQSGECNAIIGAIKDEAPSLHFPAETIGFVDATFYIKKTNPWRYSGIESLMQVRLGIIDNYFYEKKVNAYLAANPHSPNIAVSSSKEGVEGLLWRLMFGKIDVLIESSVVMQAKLKQKNLQDTIIDAGQAGANEDIYLSFSPVSPSAKQWVEWFDAGVAELRKNGSLAKILQRYNLQDWK